VPRAQRLTRLYVVRSCSDSFILDKYACCAHSTFWYVVVLYHAVQFVRSCSDYIVLEELATPPEQGLFWAPWRGLVLVESSSTLDLEYGFGVPGRGGTELVLVESST
jgi:hypothetical protein